VVSPGFTHSEMVDPYVEAAPEVINTMVRRYSAMNRLGDADEAAEAIVWLCSDASRFVNGAVLPVDGGDTARLY
jgi:A-factor type gamma-butyrolactone 1'-reductase (1S-forming)